MSTHSIPDNPMSRKEMYLAKSAGAQIEVPEPSTREEMYLKAIAENGGGGGASWGAITGTLDNQTDLKNALDAKASMNDVISYITNTILGGAD